jgi:hypothetical protein
MPRYVRPHWSDDDQCFISDTSDGTSGSDAAAIANEEYGDIDIHSKAQASLLGQLAAVLNNMTVQYPAVLCALLRREFDGLLTVVLPTIASSGAAVIDEKGQLTKSSPVYRHFAAFAVPLENCTERVPESAWQQQQQAQFIQDQPGDTPLISLKPGLFFLNDGFMLC